jgi:hypothetical protein
MYPEWGASRRQTPLKENLRLRRRLLIEIEDERESCLHPNHALRLSLRELAAIEDVIGWQFATDTLNHDIVTSERELDS